MDLYLEDIERVGELNYKWEKLKGKTIVVSGGTGFIGSFFSNVVRYRNKKYKDNIKLVSLSRHGGISDETVKSIQSDITKTIEYEGEADYILHLASNTHPKQYSEDPVGTIITNVVGCDNLLKLAVKRKSRFLLASSVEIYGQGNEKPMDEKYCGYIDCNSARAGYNEAKRTCEALCQSYRQQFGVETVIARLSRVFGPDKKKDTKAMSQFLDKAVQGEDIVLKSKGNQKFSYCYVADATSGLLKLMLDGIDGEAYNISGDYENITLGGYAELIAENADKRVVYQFEDNAAASKVTYAILDTTKIKELGWEPLYSVSDAIIRTYNIKRQMYEY